MIKRVLMLACLLLAACASAPRPAAPSVAEIVRMSQEKVADDTIMNRIRDSRGVYKLSASELIELRRQGVSEKVLDYMQNTYFDEVRRSDRAYPGVFGGVWGGGGGSGVGVGIGF